MTTKILALTDARGNLVRSQLLPGQRFDTVGVPPLIENIAFGGLIADKAFDADWIVEALNQRGAMRSDKTDASYAAMFNLTAAVIRFR